MYANLYKAIRANIRKVPDDTSIRQFLETNGIKLDESDITEIEHRYGCGDDVYWGELSDSGDDGGLAEAFFSHECFVVIGDDIYFNARNSTY